MAISNRPVRVLIVEDSAVQRKMLRLALEDHDRIEVVGHASNGEIALKKIELGGVDALTLDLEMPVMGGLEVLERLQRMRPFVGAIVVSAISQQGARATLEAMRLGAFDLITKPKSGHTPEEVVESLHRELVPRLIACGEFVANRRSSMPSAPAPLPAAARPTRPPVVPRRATRPAGPPELVVIGSSTGGPQALDAVIPALPADLGVPVLIVQHMPPMFTRTLAESLDRKSKLEVKEAQHGQLVVAGEVLIAPGGIQMGFHQGGRGWEIVLQDDPPERSCKPSVDYLFRAASQIVGTRTLAVIMTGMGDDGTASIRLLKEQGAQVVAQDEESCVVFGMPKIPVEEGLADAVLPLDDIAGFVVSACRGNVHA